MVEFFWHVGTAVTISLRKEGAPYRESKNKKNRGGFGNDSTLQVSTNTMWSKFSEQPLPSVKNQLELQQIGCDSFEWRGDNIPYTSSSSKTSNLKWGTLQGAILCWDRNFTEGKAPSTYR